MSEDTSSFRWAVQRAVQNKIKPKPIPKPTPPKPKLTPEPSKPKPAPPKPDIPPPRQKTSDREEVEQIRKRVFTTVKPKPSKPKPKPKPDPKPEPKPPTAENEDASRFRPPSTPDPVTAVKSEEEKPVTVPFRPLLTPEPEPFAKKEPTKPDTPNPSIEEGLSKPESNVVTQPEITEEERRRFLKDAPKPTEKSEDKLSVAAPDIPSEALEEFLTPVEKVKPTPLPTGAAPPISPTAKPSPIRIEQGRSVPTNLKNELKELGLDLIPVYGTYRSAKDLAREWDNLSNLQKAGGALLTGVSAVGDIFIVVGAVKAAPAVIKVSGKLASRTPGAVAQFVRGAERGSISLGTKYPPIAGASDISVISRTGAKVGTKGGQLSKGLVDELDEILRLKGIGPGGAPKPVVKPGLAVKSTEKIAETAAQRAARLEETQKFLKALKRVNADDLAKQDKTFRIPTGLKNRLDAPAGMYVATGGAVSLIPEFAELYGSSTEAGKDLITKRFAEEVEKGNIRFVETPTEPLTFPEPFEESKGLPRPVGLPKTAPIETEETFEEDVTRFRPIPEFEPIKLPEPEKQPEPKREEEEIPRFKPLPKIETIPIPEDKPEPEKKRTPTKREEPTKKEKEVPFPTPTPIPTPTPEPTPEPEPVPEPVPFPSPFPTPTPTPTPEPTPTKTSRPTTPTPTPKPKPRPTPTKPRTRTPFKFNKKTHLVVEGRVIPKKGTIAWKQGFIYIVLPPQWQQGDLIYTKKRPSGLRVYSGPKSAFKSLMKYSGKVPQRIFIDLPGIFNVEVLGRGRKLKFRRDTVKRLKGVR